MLTTSPIAVFGQAPPGFDDKSLQSLVPIHSFYAIWGGEIWGKGNQGITLLFVSLILHFQDFPSSKRLWKAECLLVSKKKRSIEDCAHDWRESCSEVYLLGLQDLRRRPQTDCRWSLFAKRPPTATTTSGSSPGCSTTSDSTTLPNYIATILCWHTPPSHIPYKSRRRKQDEGSNKA